MELLHNLGIDGKLIIAQIINFIVLLTVLRVFAYKPILKLMDDRRKKIEDGVKNAEKVDEALRDAEAQREKAIAKGHKEATVIVEKARAEGESVRADKIKEADEHAATIVEEARAQISRERQQAMDEVRSELGELVVLASEKLTRDAISPAAHKELVNQAITDLEAKN